jgi:DNA-binding transcriptional regulator LsrR (DeoR family)
MAHSERPPIDLELVRQLQAQGLSQGEIARRLGVPRSTLYDQLKRALPEKATNVHIELPLADLTDFHEMLAWWRRRKHLLAQANNAPAPTERWTLHIEKPFIARIKAEAEAEHVTVTEVVNRIIRHYYEE